MRRAGKVLTGVDRVELAYLRALLADGIPLFGLIRSRLGYLLLDEAGLEVVLPLVSAPDAHVPPEAQKRRTWRIARSHATGRVPPVLLGRMLRKALPPGVAYVNVGHSNLTARVLGAIRAMDGRIAVLVHDVIPLDFPEYQRDGAVQPFADMIGRVGAQADLLIYNSEDTKQKAEAHLPDPPASIVSHLGTELAVAAPEELPAGLPPKGPYFICIGTIEPRKNHAFLLDIWAEMGDEAPGLIIAGSRGWKSEAVFSCLDAMMPNGPVHEVSGLSDGALAALVEQSAAVLFPTHAEGFGLPATEAAGRRIPIIVNDLPVFREILGDIPIYASVSDRYLWKNNIKELAAAWPDAKKQQAFAPPTWGAHFKTVLRLT